MITQELRSRSIDLRKAGYSYNYISKQTGISKSTLSLWFSKSNWNNAIIESNKAINLMESTDRIVKINKIKTQIISDRYKKIEESAIIEFKKLKHEVLFMSGLMLYLGEGDKSTINGRIRIGNIDSSVLLIFINFLKKYCNIQAEEIKFWLLSYPDLDSDKSLKYWLKELKFTEDNIYKTQIIQGRHKTKRLLYGVGNIILSNKLLKTKILKWIELASNELSLAVIV